MTHDLDSSTGTELYHKLREAIEHLDHVLPGQAPILNFVHHNTLHGYQHLHFADALADAERRTGNRGFLTEAEFRSLYQAGRIDDEDLDQILGRDTSTPLAFSPSASQFGVVTREAIDRLSLIKGFDRLTPTELDWQIDEMKALQRWQPDLDAATRAKLVAASGDVPESAAVLNCWNACSKLLGLEPAPDHPEDLTEANRSQAEAIADEFEAISQPILGDVCPINPATHSQVRVEAELALEAVLNDIGHPHTLRDLLRMLTGIDLLTQIRPAMIRFCGSHLDEGLAAWHSPDRQLGLYAAWQKAAHLDLELELAEIPRWRQSVLRQPHDPLPAIVFNLERLGIPRNRWIDYLERIALEIPGWSGIINWRYHRPGYKANATSPTDLADYLAIRLTLDRLYGERLCRATWNIEGSVTGLRRYFLVNLSEFYARVALFTDKLPEFLTTATQQLIGIGWMERGHHAEWRAVADMIWSWRQPPAKAGSHTPHGSGWRLFRLVQHLGMTATAVSAMDKTDAELLLQTLDRRSREDRSHDWLWAYENHYRREFFAALKQNHGRSAFRHPKPDAQMVFCMDDREESIRRHLEELNPAIETFGAAGFFGVPINWRGLDDTDVTPLCPIVVNPSHEVQEQVQPDAAAAMSRHRRALKLQASASRLLHQELRRNLLSSQMLVNLLAPFALALLSAKTFAPLRENRLMQFLAERWTPPVPTRLSFTAAPDSPPASPDQPRVGFTDDEQVERVAGFLRIIGLTSNFAPFVVIVGHGSTSQNNPHLAAYDCGACSGRHGGPNARTFAAMANRPEIRGRLAAEEGIHIPERTWFLGCEHNTCNEDTKWYDLELLPPALRPSFDQLNETLKRGLYLSAHERCRRLASAPHRPSPEQAMNHMLGRATNFSQARPELGHATNAAAVIGRRSLTQGAFLDRRVFLISYDPTHDPHGAILEGILLAAGPVGAGISLEYYFSTVNNDRFGCGTKIPHNVIGLFGVMEGGCSDLRTGLPRQMIEIHEAMRLQVVVEAKTEVLAAIYHRQPPLRELIGNDWILLSAIDPDTGVISVFEPDKGFVIWQHEAQPLAEIACSTDWYEGHSEPLPPALIAVPPRELVHAD